jgi:transcriptional regulator with XRE-family HTH domain
LNFAKLDLNIVLADMDGCRKELGMSYQNLADACQVSQATVIRIFKKQSEPSMAMLQKLAAAVKYTPKEEAIILAGYTQDDYITYLQQSLEYEKEDQRLALARQEAHYNMLLGQKTRTITILSAVLFLFAISFILWLIVDITHSDIGLFQSQAQSFVPSFLGRFRALL